MISNPNASPVEALAYDFERLGMKLVMTLLVRDEEDIIASNIDSHLNKGVEFIIAMDNLSIDGATDILRLYERKGMLHYLCQQDDTYAQVYGSPKWRDWPPCNSR